MAVREEDISRQLERIDWDFRGALSSFGLHRLHWYPATFIPQIPAYLIELFTDEGETVYDPFCGVGTTLLEAIRLRRKAIGSDVNVIATMITRAKLTFWRPETLRARVSQFHGRLTVKCEKYSLEHDRTLFTSSHSKRLPAIAHRFRVLESWYHPDTWREMLVLRELVNEHFGQFRQLLEVVFSQIVKRCSSQRHHWGYVADNMVPKELVYEDAIAHFNKALDDAVTAFERFLTFPGLQDCEIKELNARSQVHHANLLDGPVVKDGSVDLIVTSPPYPNVTDYTRAQRLSLWWLEKCVDELREQEIGARYKRKRESALGDYFDAMRVCLNNAVRSLRSGKYLCLAIGESEKQQREWHVVDVLSEMVQTAGCVRAFAPIKRTRSHERLRRRDGLASEEQLLIYRKS